MKTTSLAQEVKFVAGLPAAADAAGRIGAYVSMKNSQKAYFLVTVNQGAASTVQINVLQATSVAGAGTKALAVAVPIWSNLNTSAGDAMVRRADAVNYTTDAAVQNKVVMIEVDPAFLDINNGFDCVAIQTGASSASNITSAVYILGGQRYMMDAIPTAQVD